MGSQLVKTLLAVLALATVAIGCSKGTESEEVNQAVQSPTQGTPGHEAVTNTKPKQSADQAAGNTAKAAELPPGVNREHP